MQFEFVKSIYIVLKTENDIPNMHLSHILLRKMMSSQTISILHVCTLQYFRLISIYCAVLFATMQHSEKRYRK